MRLFTELQRRGVLRMAVLYVVAAWLVMQVAEVVIGLAHLPAWVGPVILTMVAIGFPIALTLSWFYDLTPQGIAVEHGAAEGEPGRVAGGRRVYLVIIAMLSAAVVLFILERVFWSDGLPFGAARTVDEHGIDQRSLAVLPFSNRSDLNGDAYFVDGIHDDILTRLAKIGTLKVISRTSVMRYRDTELAIPEIGRALGAQYILEGGVQRGGEQVRINAQLIDAGTDEHVWAETFDRELSTDNVFAIQSEIAKAIASALDARLSPRDQQRIETAPTTSLDAYDAYLQGRRMLLATDIESLQQAIARFEQAIELDDAYAAAHAGVCEANLYLYVKTSDTAYFDDARAACERGLSLDADLAEVHVALGALYRHHGEYSRAESEQRLALAAEPRNVDALIELGLALGLQGNTREAGSVLLQAAELQPNHWPVHDALFTHYRNFDDQPDRYELAARHAMRVVELMPDVASAWNNLGTAYHSLEQYGAAKAAWDKALELAPTRTAFTNRGLQYFYEGRFEDAVEMQRKAVELAPEDHRVWGRLAESYRLLGGRETEAAEAYANAMRLAERKLEINPKDWRTRGLLATYCVHSDRPDEARAQVRSALELSGRDPEALLYAALVANEQGDTDAALAALEEMVRRDGSYRQYAVDDPDLRSLRGNSRFERLIKP